LTGHAATQDGIAGMRMGAYDYLIKPLAIDDLIKKIKEAVKTLST
ncbi:MAG: response regulator, partial [Deltaproteobacteria bacterium]|nr:response regulator [Deltaproteobacteria bacterium]